ncbi:uncharacterized protein METZ01_LOCUS435262 [marine metagenome]|uniref:Uncharacterized protein n=1 Tax=marine metagenome TaxID=408172 RepID=A0A382YIT3_9ZZZZ
MSDTVKIDKSDWDQYKKVQKSGAFNMFDPRAREMTTLTKNEWIHIISNYSDLKEKFEGGK